MRLIDIEATATHVPGQAIDTEAMLAAFGDQLSDGMRQSVRHMGIDSRHSILADYLKYLQGRAPRTLLSSTTRMAVAASGQCLAEWDGLPKDIGMVIAVTNSPDRPMPGLAYEVVDSLRGRIDTGVSTYNLQGMGCSAFIKAIELAQMFVALNPRKKVLLVVSEGLTGYAHMGDGHYRSFTEVASLEGQPGHQAAQVATQRCLYAMLFGDAAAAFVLGAPTRQPRLGFGRVAHSTNLGERDLELLTMNEGGISAPTPAQPPVYWMGKHVGQLGTHYVKEALSRLHAMAPSSSPPENHGGQAFFHVHTGSRKILDGIFRTLDLDPAGQGAGESRHVLAKYGNVAACSVAYMAANRFRSGERGNGMVVSFGMGFSASVAQVGTE